MSSTTLSARRIGLDGLPVPAAIVRQLDGAIVESNGGFVRLFGAVGAAPLAFDELAEESAQLAGLRMAPPSDGHEVEVACRRADGTPLRVLVAVEAMAADGQPHLTAVFSDITERWRRERDLTQMAQFPQLNPSPVLRFNRSGIVILANAAAGSLFGANRLLGESWLDLCPGMTPEVWQRVLTDPQPPTIEATIGERIIKFVHVRSGNQIVATFGADVTDIRRAERELTAKASELAEIARFPDMNPGPVLRMDHDAIVLLANAAAVAVFGERLVGLCWRDVCPGMNGDVWQRIVNTTEVIGLESRVGDQEFVFQHRNDPRSGFVFCFGANVTLQKQAERGLHQSEKMATLGTLAAGVAHELNNPAAAVRRAADQLKDAFKRLDHAQRLRDLAAFDEHGRAALERLTSMALEAASKPNELDGLARSDREAALEAWLEAHGFQDCWELAPALVNGGLDPATLDTVASELHGSALIAAISWVGAALPVYALTYEIGNGSTRISEIVMALKGYSYLGQAPVQEVNLHEGIDNTLIILRSKLKQGINVKREYGADVPKVTAHGSELNQVWTNIIDNAADALGGKGNIVIRTRLRDPWAIVEIEDDGPGIPPDVQSRIFDPFFTTKEPGKGTGLGLSTTYSIVSAKHHGEIEVESRPGMTRFTVKLPLQRATKEFG